MTERRICFVGAGVIAAVHAEALAALPGVKLHAIVEPNAGVGRRFAARYQVPHHFNSIDEAIEAGTIDAAHVLVPPILHSSVTKRLLQARIPVLTEKPLATNAADCEALCALAKEQGTLLAVNQNYIHYPAFARLAEAIRTHRYGRLRGVQAIYNMPLRQLASRQFDHWMFHAPLNILLEQAVHPLSQLRALIGEFRSIKASAGPSIDLGIGQRFYPESNVIIEGAVATAQLHFAVGRSLPFQQVTAICDDGIVVADIANNVFEAHGRTRWLDPVDRLVSGTLFGAGHAAKSVGNFSRYALSFLKLSSRSDPFYVSMRENLRAFYRALETNTAPETSGEFGAALVSACETIASQAFGDEPAPISAAPTLAAPAPVSEKAPDAVLLGGTGFIGLATAKRLVAAGMTVTVAARRVAHLVGGAQDGRLRTVNADATVPADVARAIGSCPVVVNLAHGGGGASTAEIEQRMVGSARIVAEACLATGARWLIHVSSIAALYCGDPNSTIVDATPPDAQPDQRADYARAKVLSERILMGLHRERGLPICILRPGLVVGAGTSPFHSGVGAYNNDQHCLGWNRGDNPLPFVLVDDVAEAILGAIAAAGVDGRSFNLVGDVRPTAREYTDALAAALERPLVYHPQSVAKLYAIEVGKWLVKTAAGKRGPLTSLRDFKSRGLVSPFDCTEAKAALRWTPNGDRAQFVDQAIRVHAA